MVYRLAVSTGLRASELRSLTPESFDLDAEQPAVAVASAYSKRRRQDLQPIRADLAGLLRPWLARRPVAVPVFGKLPGGTARMLHTDLDAARAQWIRDAKTDAEREQRERMESPTRRIPLHGSKNGSSQTAKHAKWWQMMANGTPIAWPQRQGQKRPTATRRKWLLWQHFPIKKPHPRGCGYGG
jgi:Phage integrase family